MSLLLFISFNIYNVFGQQIIFGSCNDDQFKCNDGQCIPSAWLCDFEIDCLGGEDEGEGCGSCEQHGYFCQSTNRCIPQQWRCDGWSDCPKSDDEENCNDDGIGGNIVNDNDENNTDNDQTVTTSTQSSSSSPPSPSVNHEDNNNNVELEIDTSAAWKYCPDEIVWLGFVNTFKNKDNKTSVYWIEPKVKQEGTYYEKYSTTFNSGDQFGVGFYSIKYIAKKIILNNTNTNNENNQQIMNDTNTDDPIFCSIQLLVLDGMSDNKIEICDHQTKNEYLEWEFLVDDRNYDIAYYSINEQHPDISRARFVPNMHKFHTNCYAQILFQTGSTENEQEVVIEETVSWIVGHLYAFIGLIVGIVLLFCILITTIIVLWRKHVEMKEYITADDYDKDEEVHELIHDDNDDEMDDTQHNIIMMNHRLNMIDTHRQSTIDLDVTTPGGGNGFFDTHPKIINEDDIIASIDDDSSESNDTDITDSIDIDSIKLSKTKKQKLPPRRPSILGVTADQLKLLQDNDTKRKLDKDANKLLEEEWERESDHSQDL